MSLPDDPISKYSLCPKAAKNLSNPTITIPMMESITPKWLLKFLPWIPVEAGVYRVNKVKKCNNIRNGRNEYCEKLPELYSSHLGEHEIPQTFPDYEENPEEYTLNIVQTILKINGQVADIFNSPIDQIDEQMRLTIEAMKENQEWEIINNKNYGLLNKVSPVMRIQPKAGAPTPDDLDELLAKVWKQPAFFLAHPRAIAAFGRECTKRGVPPATANMYGVPFITWRGVPILPCDKLQVDCKTEDKSSCGTTNILLMRVGEKEQGVIGIHQPNIPNSVREPSLSVRFAGIDNLGIASYMMTLYFGVVILTDDSIGMLENVEVGRYHEYK